MDLSIIVNTNKFCRIEISDNTQYPSEDRITHLLGEFKQSLSIPIVVIKHNKILSPTYLTKIYKHKDRIEVPINLDGWFDVYYIVLPTKEWVIQESQVSTGSNLSSYNYIYCSDGDKIYSYKEGKFTEIDSIQTLITLKEESSVKTTISLAKSEHISICYLRKCYIDLCKLIFESRALSPCGFKNTIDSELVYRRDLVWMAINVITYLNDLHSECHPTLAEIERIVEIIHSCNGVCKPPYLLNNTIKSNDCGCFKK